MLYIFLSQTVYKTFIGMHKLCSSIRTISMKYLLLSDQFSITFATLDLPLHWHKMHTQRETRAKWNTYKISLHCILHTFLLHLTFPCNLNLVWLLYIFSPLLLLLLLPLSPSKYKRNASFPLALLNVGRLFANVILMSVFFSFAFFGNFSF